MIKAIRNSKWYWYVPFVAIFTLRQLSKWTINGKDYEERLSRWILVQLLMIPSIIGALGLILTWPFWLKI